MKTPVVLRVYKSDQLIAVKQFTDEQIVIGRQPDVQVPVDDPVVSIIHAAIEERDSGYYICDLGSDAGTFHNGQSILDAKLEPGDQVRVGDVLIEFFLGAPKPKAPPPKPDRPPKAAPGVAKPSETTAAAAPQVPDGPPPGADALSQAQSPSPSNDAFVLETVTPPKPSSSEPHRVPESQKATISKQASSAPGVQHATGMAAAVSTSGPASVPGSIPNFISEPEPVRSPSVPDPRSTGKGHGKKKGATFAPPSKYNNIKEYIRPSKGTVVEVLVAWKERVINTFHFSRPGLITMGSTPDNDVVLPIFISRQKKVPLVKIDGRAIILISTEMTGELVRQQGAMSFVELARQNRMTRDGKGYSLVLDQGEMIRIDVSDQVCVIVRYTSDSPKPLAAPMLDMTAAEFTAVIMALVMVGVLGLYMFLYSPPEDLLADQEEEPLRTALIITKPPPRAPPPPAPKEPERPAPTPEPPKVKSTPVPKPVPDPKPKAQQVAQAPKQDPGRAADVAPNKNKTGPKKLTSVKQGGSIKVGNTAGAQAQAPKKDVSKAGVFSVFGGGGAQNELSQSYSGSGELAGLADASSGRAGQNVDRPGEGIGTPFQDTGRGGTGVAAVGIPGVKTKGRGSGDAGFGQGGLGTRKGVQIVPGGTEEAFTGSIDREAVRRVIMNNMRAIKSCYERELNRTPDLFGKIVLAWEVGEQGRVLRTRVKSSTMNSDTVAGCVMSRLKTWRFPEPPRNEEYAVEYPFVFSSN